MQLSASHVLPASPNAAAPLPCQAGAGTAMECLALALLQIAERHEMEAGLSLHITPPLAMAVLAGLAGLAEMLAASLLDELVAAGFVQRRRQRLVVAQPAALYRLALGAPV